MNELPNDQWDRDEEDSCSMIRKQGTPAPVPPEDFPRQRRSFWRAIGVFLGLCRDYTAEDIARLKEAGLQIVEGRAAQERAKAKRDDAEGERLLAEAALIHEQSDAPKRRDALRVMELRLATAGQETEIEVARRNAADSEAARAQAMASAMERLRDAISTLQSKGGGVAFDSEQLLKLLEQGIAEHPADSKLTELMEHLLEPAEGSESEGE